MAIGGGFLLVHQAHLREYVAARKFVNTAKEMAMKASIYNGFTRQGRNAGSPATIMPGHGFMQRHVKRQSNK